MWNNNDDMKYKFQNRTSVKKITTNFNTQDNNETTLAARLTADNSTTNNNIIIGATRQQQTSFNGNSNNEKPEASKPVQSDNLKSF